jgi:hypothetical protein
VIPGGALRLFHGGSWEITFIPKTAALIDRGSFRLYGRLLRRSFCRLLRRDGWRRLGRLIVDAVNDVLDTVRRSVVCGDFRDNTGRNAGVWLWQRITVYIHLGRSDIVPVSLSVHPILAVPLVKVVPLRSLWRSRSRFYGSLYRR